MKQTSLDESQKLSGIVYCDNLSWVSTCHAQAKLGWIDQNMSGIVCSVPIKNKDLTVLRLRIGILIKIKNVFVNIQPKISLSKYIVENYIWIYITFH